MNSRFSIKSIIYSIVIICLSILIPYILFSWSDNIRPEEEGKAIISILFTGIILFYFVFVELRLKFIRFKINGDIIQVRKCVGLAKTKEYKLSDFDGHKITYAVSGIGKFEDLLLTKNNEKIISISEFHIGNYKEIKKNIKRKTNYLGIEEYDFFDEIIDTFKKRQN
jgi:hypothetical protein